MVIPPNEDEYSAALERLLEGCPARTRCSSQIGSKVGVEGGVQITGLKWGSWVGGVSGDDWACRQAGETRCLCAPLANEQKAIHK